MATLRQTSSANTPRRPCMWPKPIGRLTKSVLQSFAPSVGKNTSMARELDSKRSVRNSRSPAAARSTTRSRRPSAGRSSAKSVSKSMSPKSIGSTKRNARPKVKRFAMVMDMISIANMCLKKFVTRWEKKIWSNRNLLSICARHAMLYADDVFSSDQAWKSRNGTHKNTTRFCHLSVTNGPENLPRKTSKLRATFGFYYCGSFSNDSGFKSCVMLRFGISISR